MFGQTLLNRVLDGLIGMSNAAGLPGLRPSPLSLVSRGVFALAKLAAVGSLCSAAGVSDVVSGTAVRGESGFTLLQRGLVIQPSRLEQSMPINTLSKDTISQLTLAKADEVLATRQKELAEIFAEAGTSDGKYDFNQVKCLGEQIKGSVAVADAVQQINSEMAAVGEALDALRGAEKAAAEHAERSKGRRNFPLPAGGGAVGRGNYGSEQERFKSLGEMVAETKAYKDWAGSGAAGGISLNFDEVLPSDFQHLAQKH
jgi:hypothetical protein